MMNKGLQHRIRECFKSRPGIESYDRKKLETTEWRAYLKNAPDIGESHER